MSGFADSLQGHVGGYKKRLSAVVRKSILGMTSEIIRATPLDTGMAKNNYFWGVDRVTAIEPTPDKSGSASIARAESFTAQWETGGVCYITNNLPYIMPLEFGHSTQAPAGMARITVEKWQQFVNAAVQAIR